MTTLLDEIQDHTEDLHLLSDTFFYCQKEHSRMRKAECLRFQNIAKKKVKMPYHGAVMTNMGADRILCRDCKQGKEIREGLI